VLTDLRPLAAAGLQDVPTNQRRDPGRGSVGADVEVAGDSGIGKPAAVKDDQFRIPRLGPNAFTGHQPELHSLEWTLPHRQPINAAVQHKRANSINVPYQFEIEPPHPTPRMKGLAA